MTDKYPIPSYAAHIWIAGDKIWLGFPSPEAGVSKHSISVPNNEIGLGVALKILRARDVEDKHWLSTRGAPTRHQVERDLVRDKRYNELLRALEASKKVSAAERAKAEEFLKELGRCTELIQIRVAKANKILLKDAAKMSGQTLSAFIRDAVTSTAIKVLFENNIVVDMPPEKKLNE
jgi:hypothetical protein